MSKRTPNVDYDNNWKEVVEKQLANVVSFFLPNFHPHVDWTRKPEFLEQEMRIIRRNTQKGRKKIVDKLVKVWLKTGEEYWILIHIEIESSDKVGFNKRMFTYFSRAYDKFNVPIVALALLVGEKPPPSYDCFKESFFGTNITYQYNAYVVIDQTEQDLLASDNIMALFILANLYTLQTKDEAQRRLELKKKLYELAMERNIFLENIDSLLKFVFDFMTLPVKEESNFFRFVERKQKKEDMTETAFQKRRLETSKNIANLHTKSIYGLYASEMVRQIEAKDNALKEKDNVLKEKDETIHRLIIFLYAKEGGTLESIAALLEMPLEAIQNIVSTYNKDPQ